MGQTPEERKKQYIAVAIVIAVVVSAIAMLIAFKQEEDEGVVVNTNPLMQRSGSFTSASLSSGSSLAGQPGKSAEIAVSPRTSDAEGQLRVQGVGFEPDEKVTVTLEDRALETEPSEVAADEQGRFSAEATVPEPPPGQYEVVAIGEKGSLAMQHVTIT